MIGLAGLLVGADAERRILFRESLDGRAELLLVGLGLRLDRHGDNRLREGHRLQYDGITRIAQGVTCGGVLQPHDSNDVAGARGVDLLALVGVHSVDLSDPLLAVLGAIEDLGSGLQRPE